LVFEAKAKDDLAGLEAKATASRTPTLGRPEKERLNDIQQ